MQGLRTQNEQLRRVNARIDTLIEDIREELLARTDTSLELGDRKIKKLLRYIANPLRNLSIDGNEDMLHDKSDIYERVIKELQGIVDRKRYSDGRELSDSEIKSFEKAKDLLKTEKEQGIDVISQVYKEIIDEKKGKLESTFIKDKVEADSRVVEIRTRISAIEQELLTTLEPARRSYIDVLDGVQPQLGRFIKGKTALENLIELDDKIAKIYEKMKDPSTPRGEREELSKKRNLLYDRQISIIKETNPEEYNKHDYERKSKEVNGKKQWEPMNQYAGRLREKFNKSYEHDKNILITKLNNVLDNKIGVLEVDPSTGKSTVKEVTIRDRYFPNVGTTVTYDDVVKFSEGFQKDMKDLGDHVTKTRIEKIELEDEKTELTKVLAQDMRSASLVKVPYLERQDGQNLSAFAKWRQRMAFRFGNPSYLFKGREAVEQAMVQKKIDEATLKISKKDLLRDVEEQQREFKDELRVKTKVKANIFRKWENEISQNRQEPDGR